MSEIIADLAPEARVRRYRELAEETHALAQKAESPSVRSAYLQLAAQWFSLADNSERMAEAAARAPGSSPKSP